MKINFIYSRGRRIRLDQEEKFPCDFFYGYQALRKSEYQLNLFEEIDLGMYVNKRWLKIILRKLSFFSFGIPLEMIYGFITWAIILILII